MTPQEAFEKVKVVIADTFDHPINQITPATTSLDIDGWDSLQHTILMIRLENQFGVPMTEEIAESANVGEMAERISRHLG